MEMKRLRVRITFTEDVLGTCPNNTELHTDYVASKAPDAARMEEEIEAMGASEYAEKGMTVFPRSQSGEPMLYDYQIKGFFKDSAKALKKVSGSHCSTVKSFIKEIDGLLFVFPRCIPIQLPEGTQIGRCQRPLRANGPMGERIALSDSESCPAGSCIDIEIGSLTDSMMKLARECLDYGALRGIGQWRNSGKGRFTYQILEP